MQKEIIYGLAGLFIGAFIAVMTASNAVNNQNFGMMRAMRMGPTADIMSKVHEHEPPMEEMIHMLDGLTGDRFDKTFLSTMIEHHEGAVEMAEEAKESAKHQEIKDLADDIIEAQTREIEQMEQWEKDWGY